MNASTVDVIIGVIIGALLNNTGAVTLFVKERLFYAKLNILILWYVPGSLCQKWQGLQKSRKRSEADALGKISYHFLPRGLKRTAGKISRIVSIFSDLHTYNRATNKGEICFFFVFPDSKSKKGKKIISLLGEIIEMEEREWTLINRSGLFCLTTMSTSDIPPEKFEEARKDFNSTSGKQASKQFE